MSLPADDEFDRLVGAPHPRFATRFVGHADQERALLDDVRRSRLPHAIILGGPAGIGKATLAWRLAKFLLANPRERTDAVQAAMTLDVGPGLRAVAQVESLSHPDIVILRRAMNDKTKRFYTEIRADDVRRAIGLFQQRAGAEGYRICIVDSAEDLNRSSANALLKLIEEPPPASLFLLVAHRPGLILPTIRSRARLMRLDPLTPEEIARIIATLGTPWSDMDATTVREAAARAQGSVRDAMRLLGHHGVGLAASIKRMLEQLPSTDWREVHKLADTVAGRDADEAYETTLTAIFDWLAAKVRQTPAASPRSLAPYAEVWEKVAQSTRETDALNLDKRPLILSIFSDLAAAVRASSA